LAPEVVEDLKNLKANMRTAVRDALEIHLRHEPTKISRSRIKRLRGLSRPQYRLRVGEIRVFYDVSGATVEVLAIVAKSEAESWLARFAIPSERGSALRDQRRPVSLSARGRDAGNRDCASRQAGGRADRVRNRGR